MDSKAATSARQPQTARQPDSWTGRQPDRTAGQLDSRTARQPDKSRQIQTNPTGRESKAKCNAKFEGVVLSSPRESKAACNAKIDTEKGTKMDTEKGNENQDVWTLPPYRDWYFF